MENALRFFAFLGGIRFKYVEKPTKFWDICALMYKSVKRDLCEKEKMRENTPQFDGNTV